MSPYIMPGIRKEQRPSMVKQTIEAVLSYKGYALSQIANNSHKRDIVYTRQLIEYFLCMENTYSLKRIGRVFGFQRDHSTVIYSRDTIRDLMFSDPSVNADVININNLLNKKNEC